MQTLRELTILKDKKILLRTDFDMPLGKDFVITEPFRILKQKPLIDYLINQGAKVVMVAHISAPPAGGPPTGGFAELMPQLHILLGHEVGFIKKPEDIPIYFENYQGVGLLENIRQFNGEIDNDEKFAQSLSKGFDLYINNAFAVCHRKHTSVSAITKFLPSYAGPLIEEETAKLSEAIGASKEGKILIIGGAKATTKVPVIKNFLDKAEKILLGGVVANDFLKAKGVDVKSSVVDNNYLELLAGLDLNSPVLLAPSDFNFSEEKILDIGPQAMTEYSKVIQTAKMIIWNGPMGMFEDDRFAGGTKAIAEAIIGSNAFKIVGGGDTIAAINKFGLAGKFDASARLGTGFVSTGGGAMLSFLAGERLPGLETLGYYD